MPLRRRRKKRKPRKAPDLDQTLSASQFPSDTVTERPPSVRQQARAIEQELADACGPIIRKLDAWLTSLEGRQFPVAEAEREIAAITHAVAAAGRQLIFKDEPVTLYCDTAVGRKHAKIRVVTIGAGPQKELWSRAVVPRLRTRPIP